VISSYYTHCYLTLPAPKDVDIKKGSDEIRERVSQFNLAGAHINLSQGTIDAMKYDNNRLLVVVSGSFTAKDQQPRPFTQSFILVGQNNSFFVSNSVFRLLGEASTAAPMEVSPAPVVAQTPAPAPVPTPAPVPEPVVEPIPAPQPEPVPEVKPTPEPVVEEAPAAASPTSTATTAEVVDVQETKLEPVVVEEVDVTAKSYSDIVKKLAKKTQSAPEENKKGFRTIPSKPAATTAPAVAPAAEPVPAAAAASAVAPATSKRQRRTDIFPVYITGYAKDAKEDELLKLFSKYGEVYQVEIVKGKDFGFVKFEEESSMQAALDSKTLEIDGNVIRIEKRTVAKKPSSKDGDKKSGDKNGSKSPRSNNNNNNKGKSQNREGRDNNNNQKKASSKPTA
jgi:hypothetical protein